MDALWVSLKENIKCGTRLTDVVERQIVNLGKQNGYKIPQKDNILNSSSQNGLSILESQAQLHAQCGRPIKKNRRNDLPQSLEEHHHLKLKLKLIKASEEGNKNSVQSKKHSTSTGKIRDAQRKCEEGSLHPTVAAAASSERRRRERIDAILRDDNEVLLLLLPKPIGDKSVVCASSESEESVWGPILLCLPDD
ncbi:nucleic acid-binding protein [Senna tora]|uniref:Nucleic acid-binding protein n=1 Tax=Senna tora TaxID=362788 RepID=A0A834WST2_9FABA|nr:nucleic acid-binding protein [Senna tora]